MAREATSPSCPQCGGPVEVPEGAAYVRCGYCASESFVDLTGVLLHQVLRVAVSRARVPGLIKARALEAGRREARVTRLELIYEPVWELESPDGRRVCISARPGPEGRFNRTELPGGERALADTAAHGDDAEWFEPQLAPESLAEVAARATGRPVVIKTIRLLHRPIYRVRTRVADDELDLQLDALSGELLDAEWPAEVSYRSRNRAWLATGAMVAVAALLPAPLAVLAVVVLGGITARALWRSGAATLPGAT